MDFASLMRAPLEGGDHPNGADFDFPTDPRELFKQVALPQPASFPTPAEVRTQAKEYSFKIFTTWGKLNQIVTRREDVLRKRWMKRTKEQRRKVLTEAWPNMPQNHRPDFQALAKESPAQRAAGTKYPVEYQWPSVNIDDLTQSRPLLLLLNARGRHLPHFFANADYKAVHVGRVSGAIRPAFLNNHTMLLDGQITPESYGQLIAWDDNDNAFEWMISAVGVAPGEGLLILQIQERLLKFLVQCCVLLMPDVDPEHMAGSDLPLISEPTPLVANDTSYVSLAAVAADAPYRLPGQLDLLRVKMFVAAELAAAEDHIWDLREDPSYFASVVREWSEHRQETLLDTRGRTHPHHDDFVFWDRVLGNVIGDAYATFLRWHIVHEKLVDLIEMKRKYSTVISRSRPLPEAYLKALQSFQHLLKEECSGPIELLKTGVPASPPLRSHFLREPQESGSTMIQVRTKSAVGNDPLLRVFTFLCDKQRVFLLGISNLMDEVERLVQSDAAQRKRLSSWVMDVFGDLAIIAQILQQIDLYQPWASQFESSLDHDLVEADYKKSVQPIAEYKKSFTRAASMAKIVVPLRTQLEYPVDKPRDKSNTELMRKAEGTLDAFWTKADRSFVDGSGNSHHTAIQRLFLHSRQIQRTPEWSEHVAPLRKAHVSISEESSQAFQALGHIQRDGVAGAKMISITKQKPKTRGTADLEPVANVTEQLERLEPDEQPVFQVSKRAYKVFSTLFHTPSLSATPGEVPWTDFLHAMTSTGFAAEKLYGSVWQFTPTTSDVVNGIHVHEPHPSSKLAFRTARRLGRRLHRTYGWTGEMFTLES